MAVRRILTSECFLDSAHGGDGYQRRKDKHAQQIALEYDPARWGVFEVSDRSTSPDGQLGPQGERYAIIDGGTRWLAAGALQLSATPSIIHEGLTRPQEAKLFRKFADGRIALSALDRFRARLCEGDEVALAVQRIVDECGWTLSTGSSDHHRGRHALAAVVAVEEAYGEGEPTLRRALDCLTPWGDEGAVKGPVVRGMASFIAEHGPRLDLKRVKTKLASEPAAFFYNKCRLQKARMGSGTSLADVVAAELTLLYNKSRRVNRLAATA